MKCDMDNIPYVLDYDFKKYSNVLANIVIIFRTTGKVSQIIYELVHTYVCPGGGGGGHMSLFIVLSKILGNDRPALTWWTLSNGGHKFEPNFHVDVS
jgi:hypothetical protein